MPTSYDSATSGRLIAMIGMWYAEAGKYNVLPIDSRGTMRMVEERPRIAVARTKYMYYPGTQGVPGSAAPRVLNCAHSVTVEATIHDAGVEGVLFAMGGNDGGFSFYVQNGKLTYGYNYVADKHFKVESNERLPKGHHLISFEFEPTGKAEPLKGKGTPATIRLFVDGKEVGRGDLPVTIPNSLGLGAAVTVGADPGSPTMPDYQPPFAFTGAITRALVDITGTRVETSKRRCESTWRGSEVEGHGDAYNLALRIGLLGIVVAIGVMLNTGRLTRGVAPCRLDAARGACGRQVG